MLVLLVHHNFQKIVFLEIKALWINVLCVQVALKQRSRKERELYGQNRIAEGKVPVCAAMCSTKALLVGESSKIEEIYHNRLMNRIMAFQILRKV